MVAGSPQSQQLLQPADALQVLDKIPEPSRKPDSLAMMDLQILPNESLTSSRTLGASDSITTGAGVEEQPVKDTGSSKWTSFFKDNRKGGLSVPSFPKSEGPISLPQELYQCLKTKWGHCLIGYIAGRFPGHKAILDMCKAWGVKFSYHTHASGWLVFKFDHEESMDKVLAEGPYFVFQRPLLLKPMPNCFNFGKEEFNKVPVWVQVWGLPLNYWHPQALGRILSQIGTPLRTDELTLTKGASLNYARVLVEIDVTNPYQEELQLINHLQMEFKVQLVYENKPKFCDHCKIVGHLEASCRMKAQPSAPPCHTQTVVPRQESRAEETHPAVQGTSDSHLEPDETIPVIAESEIIVGENIPLDGIAPPAVHRDPAFPGDPDKEGFSPATTRKLKKERAAAKKAVAASLNKATESQVVKKHKGGSKNKPFHVGGGALLLLSQ